MPSPRNSCSRVTPRQRGVRPAGAVLQVHVAHRQADDGDAGLGDGAQRLGHEFVGLHGERAAMAALHAALEAEPHRHVRRSRPAPWRPDRRFRRHAGRGRGRDPSPAGRALEQLAEFRGSASCAPPFRRVTQPRMPPASATMSASRCALRLGKGVHRHQAGRLQLDPAGPGIAHRLKTGQEISAWGASELRWVRTATVPCA